MAKVNIFFSHLTIERELAELIQKALTRDFIGLVHISVSSDITSIPAGQKWLDRVVENVNTADLHLVLCSPEAVKRPWINIETGAALMKGIDVIPICHSGLTPAQLPVPLSHFEAVLASERAGLAKLYSTIAAELESAVPDARLDELIREVRAFEDNYTEQAAEANRCEFTPTTTGVIVSPRVLCVSCPQFFREGMADFEIILKAFPNSVEHKQLLDASAVQDCLMQESFDIVHVATYICPKSGDLVFSEIDTATGEDICHSREFITADVFADLIKTNQVKLVVVASCESFKLAAKLIPVTNVIGTRDMIDARMFASWIQNFYRVLPVRPLSEAFNYAAKASRAPMRLFAQQELIMTRSETNKSNAASIGANRGNRRRERVTTQPI